MEEDSDDEKQEHDERLYKDRETTPLGVQNVKESSSSEERKADESSESMREKANGEAESESEGNQGNNSLAESNPQEIDAADRESSSLDGVGDAEIPEDEPLSKWKPRSGKKSSGKKR